MLQNLVDERRDLMVKLADIERAITLEMARVHQSVIPVDRDLLTAAQAAKKLNCSRVWLYERARLGEIKSVRIGRSVRFRLEDLT